MSQRDPILRSVHATLCKLVTEGESHLFVEKKYEGDLEFVGASQENFNFAENLTSEQAIHYARMTGEVAHVIKYDLIPYLMMDKAITAVEMQCKDFTIKLIQHKKDWSTTQPVVIDLGETYEPEMIMKSIGVEGAPISPEQFIGNIHFMSGTN